jgi:hypothetical protein
MNPEAQVTECLDAPYANQSFNLAKSSHSTLPKPVIQPCQNQSFNLAKTSHSTPSFSLAHQVIHLCIIFPSERAGC